MFQPIKRKRVYIEIINQLQNLIDKGELKPGDKLMSERELSEKLKVSRSSVREAFSALELMGILESRPGEGTFISSASATASALLPMSMLMLLGSASEDLLELRWILEGEGAKLAAERASEENINQIKSIWL